MNRTHIDYSDDLNGRQKENHNAAKLSAVLADYGYFPMWLNDDYNGADLIALREGGGHAGQYTGLISNQRLASLNQLCTPFGVFTPRNSRSRPGAGIDSRIKTIDQ